MILPGRVLGLSVILLAGGCSGQFHFDDPLTVAIPPDAAADATAAPAPCTIDAQCLLSTLHCDVPTGRCVACVKNSDCAALAEPVCVENRCVECAKSSDCPVGALCDSSSQRCVQQCPDLDNDDCTVAAPTCDITRAVCVRCTDDSQCTASAPLCQVSVGQCVQCLHDSQCPVATPRCDWNGACVACRTSTDCAAGKQCDPSAHVCL